MKNWDDFYQSYADKTEPEIELVRLVSTLKKMNIVNVLDVGCGTGRNSIYLAQQGFRVYGIDISKMAIQIAKKNSIGLPIEYFIGQQTRLPFQNNSIDFILANHSLEYLKSDDILRTVREFDRVLKNKKPIFLKVDSKEYNYQRLPLNLENLAHVLFCIKNKIPIHFFSERELRCLFDNYDIKKLEHIEVDESDGDYIREFYLFALKRYTKMT